LAGFAAIGKGNGGAGNCGKLGRTKFCDRSSTCCSDSTLLEKANCSTGTVEAL